jgi:hypothetical protein
MHIQLQLVITADDGSEHRHQIVDLARDAPTLATLGVTLAESKQILGQLQQVLIGHQVAAYLDQQRPCPACGTPRRIKQQTTAPFCTLFGRIQIENPRWYHCGCQSQSTKTLRPLAQLLPERMSPELRYLELKWASLVSYELTTRLLHEVLPIDATHSAITVRNHLLDGARRLEQQLGDDRVMVWDTCQAERDRLPIPDGPLAVGLDGAIVRARRGSCGAQTANLFEVIAGKSTLAFRRDEPDGMPPTSKCFALVQRYDTKPHRRLFDLLTSQGMQANQQVTFFTDGGETVRRLPENLYPQAEHILDWFHLTMRITVLQQCARGLPDPPGAQPATERTLERRLESVKHHLWHGNTRCAMDELGVLDEILESWEYDEDGNPALQPGHEAAARMRTYSNELGIYVANNAASIVNYGERHRQGERISTGFVESTVNYVVSKRMVKKQQMQWTPEGAHLLLQVRTQVLNNEWEATVRSWYPGFRPAGGGNDCSASGGVPPTF